jgi:hypothetical protein
MLVREQRCVAHQFMTHVRFRRIERLGAMANVPRDGWGCETVTVLCGVVWCLQREVYCVEKKIRKASPYRKLRAESRPNMDWYVKEGALEGKRRGQNVNTAGIRRAEYKYSRY